MRIFIATDAWRPQVNGVVRTYENLERELESQGHAVDILSPLDFPTVPCPGYREIRLARARRAIVANILKHGAYDHVHIATEGPIGWATRSVCMNAKVRFTTAFHTRFPEYIEAYTGLPAWLGYAVQKHFHAPSLATLVATPSLKDDLARRGFERLMLCRAGLIRRSSDLWRRSRGMQAAKQASRPFSTLAAFLAKRTSPPSSISICRGARSWLAKVRCLPH